MLSLSPSAFAQPWDLEGCIEYAIVHNPDILHRKIQYDVQKEVLGQSKIARVPVVTIGAQETLHSGNALIMYSVDENLTMSLTQVAAMLEMPLITGRSIPPTRTAEENALKAAAENIIVSKINVRIRVAAAYLQLLTNISQEQIARQQVTLCEEHLKSVTRLVEEGKRTNADLAEAHSALSSAEYMFTSAAGNTTIARIHLINLIGLDDGTGFVIKELDEDVEDIEMNSLLSLLGGLDTHPSVLAAKYNVTGAEYRAKAARGALYPRLSLFANYNSYFYAPIGIKEFHIGSQLGANDWAAVGFKLAIPILDLNVRKQISRADLAFRDAQVSFDESRREITRQLREAYYQTLTARDRYISAEKAESSARESYNFQKKMYEVGRCTTYDLDQSRLRWYAASEETVKSKYEYLLRNKIMEYYINYSGE